MNANGSPHMEEGGRWKIETRQRDNDLCQAERRVLVLGVTFISRMLKATFISTMDEVIKQLYPRCTFTAQHQTAGKIINPRAQREGGDQSRAKN